MKRDNIDRIAEILREQKSPSKKKKFLKERRGDDVNDFAKSLIDEFSLGEDFEEVLEAIEEAGGLPTDYDESIVLYIGRESFRIGTKEYFKGEAERIVYDNEFGIFSETKGFIYNTIVRAIDMDMFADQLDKVSEYTEVGEYYVMEN